MLTTSRLTIFPLTAQQLQLYMQDTVQLERSLGLPPGQRGLDEFLKSILASYTLPRLNNPALDPLYHTLWTGLDRERGVLIGEAKFKGEPDETGTIEIGYGTHPAFQGQGYMTELVGGLLPWAWQQPGVQRVVAETHKDNLASQGVLRANMFRQTERVEDMLWWEAIAC